ncbi:MAG: hypothetical protein ACI37Z_06330 [Candidatus Gastranaerophilaceae bacterium]
MSGRIPIITNSDIPSPNVPNARGINFLFGLPKKYQNYGINLGTFENALNSDIIVPLVKHKVFVNYDFSKMKNKMVDYIGLLQ